MDQGPEFEGQVLDASADQAGVGLSFVRTGTLVKNPTSTLVPNDGACAASNRGKADRVQHRAITQLGNLTPEEYAKNRPVNLGLQLRPTLQLGTPQTRHQSISGLPSMQEYLFLAAISGQT
ncbi:MAG: hypothetical protein NVS9B15_25150 [Acidobacteriaceae bacterium]